jgi:hypothetical protein
MYGAGGSIIKTAARTNVDDNMIITYSCRRYTEEDTKKDAEKDTEKDPRKAK